MKMNIEVLLDTNANGGCGCNCGCSGSTVVDDMNELVEELTNYDFKTEFMINVVPISTFETTELINKVNSLLENTSATFRVTEDNIDETLQNLLPIIALNDSIITAYGVPTLYDVILEVEKNL